MDAETLLHCPLCCGGTFKCKPALVEHLSNHTTNFGCPICSYKFSSVLLLVEHLSSTDCTTPLEVSEPHNALCEHTLFSRNIDGVRILVTQDDSASIEKIHADDDGFDGDTAADNDSSQLHDDNLEHNKMYTDLLQVSETLGNDQSDYSIAHTEDAEIMTRASIITKQNSDGTLSISTYNEKEDTTMKEEAMPVITVTDNESVGHDELFSCNTCGVSFLSVIDHIQNYHKDQDVVVEMNENQDGATIEFVQEAEMDSSENNMPMELVSIMNNSTDNAPPASAPHRIITDTGDIVETTVAPSNTSKGSPLKDVIPLSSLEMEVVDKKGRLFTRRYVQIDKGDTSINEAAAGEARTPYHQVVMKEVRDAEGGEQHRVYHCIACHVYVKELDEFKTHPCKTLKYTCAHCPVSYENAKSLCAHMKVHKSAKQAAIKAQFKNANLKGSVPVNAVVTGPFKCDVCTTVFPTNKSLKLHKRMHDPIKSRPIDPPVEENNESTEENQAKYFCSLCLKWIPVGYRAVHQEFHEDTANFNCDICNKKFSSSSYLAMHMNVHSVEKAEVKKSDKTLPYTCLYCTRQFARPHEKVKHERIHTGEKPHSCEICGKSFRVSYCLTLHMRTHTGARPYACHICGKRFKAHSVYNHHLLTHSDVRAYKCPFCPKAFKTSVQLAGHKNSHTKPFACTHCNRPFASLYAVRVHTETHRRQNNLKFACALCGASYARSFALKDHMKSAHNTDDTGDYKLSEVVNLTEEKGWEISKGKLITTPNDDEQEAAAMEIPNEPESVIV